MYSCEKGVKVSFISIQLTQSNCIAIFYLVHFFCNWLIFIFPFLFIGIILNTVRVRTSLRVSCELGKKEGEGYSRFRVFDIFLSEMIIWLVAFETSNSYQSLDFYTNSMLGCKKRCVLAWVRLSYLRCLSCEGDLNGLFVYNKLQFHVPLLIS